jgi:hypothetical protein
MRTHSSQQFRSHRHPAACAIEAPSPAEVRRMCREIQSRWTPAERSKRVVAKSGPWSAPIVKAMDLGLDDLKWFLATD